MDRLQHIKHHHCCEADFALSEATEFKACINLFDLLGTCMCVSRARFAAGLRPAEEAVSRGLLVPILIASLIS